MNLTPNNKSKFHRIKYLTQSNEISDFVVLFVSIIDSSRYSEMNLTSLTLEILTFNKSELTTNFTTVSVSIIVSSCYFEIKLTSKNESNFLY